MERLHLSVNNKEKALHSASAKGNLETVKSLILEEKWDIEDIDSTIISTQNREEEYDKTPLYLACENGHLPVVQFLVEQGAKMNYHRYNHDYKNCQNPIVIAAENGHLEVMRYLAQEGAEMDYSCSNVKNDKMSDDKDSNNNTYSNMTNTINSTNICYNTTRNTFTNKKNNNNNSNSNNENVCKRIHIAENIEENLILVNIENSVEDIVNYIFESSCK